MTIQEMYEKCGFDIGKALNNFQTIYPDQVAYPCGITGNGKLMISVGGGYHVIDENTISKFYTNAAAADQDNEKLLATDTIRVTARR